jgi:hypothetical protein
MGLPPNPGTQLVRLSKAKLRRKPVALAPPSRVVYRDMAQITFQKELAVIRKETHLTRMMGTDMNVSHQRFYVSGCLGMKGSQLLASAESRV